MTRSRVKGTRWESAIVAYLQAVGVPYAERRALAGATDRGDIAGIPGVVIEGKCAARVELAEWLDEAEAERVNAGAAVGVVWFKRRGKASAGDGFVLLSGATLVQLLRDAGYLPPAMTRGGGRTCLTASATSPPGISSTVAPMDDLLAQLRAALDEDERVALAAAEAEAYITLTVTAMPPDDGDKGARALVEHYRRHRPADTLRWVAAARKVLERHRPVHEVDPEYSNGDPSCWGCGFGSDERPLTPDARQCPDVRALVGVYGIGEAGDG